MDLRSWFRSSVILLVLMIGILVLGAAVTGVNIGPVELLIWLIVLIAGLILIGLGSRKRAS